MPDLDLIKQGEQACDPPEATHQSRARSSATFSCGSREAVSITMCGRSHVSYSREMTACHFGSSSPSISDCRVSTRRRCSATSEQITSISITSVDARYDFVVKIGFFEFGNNMRAALL